MHRIDAAGYAAGNLFTDGNPSTGTPATVVDAAWLNDIQENLAQLIEAAGIVLSKGDYTQLLKAIVTKGMQGSYFNIGTAGGTADAITATYTPAIAALSNGMTLYVRAASANATTTPTFTPNSGTIAAKTIVKGAGAALAAGDIAGGGHWIELQYDATLDKWVLLNPANGISGLTQGQADARYCGIGYMLVKHELAQGTNAGASVAGVQTRPLNTVSSNTISGASLASNQITLPAGTYRIRAEAVAEGGNPNRSYLYNVTDAANAILGTSEDTMASGASDYVSVRSAVIGRITIASAKVFELRQYISQAVATYGLGIALNAVGNEVYAFVEIIKES